MPSNIRDFKKGERKINVSKLGLEMASHGIGVGGRAFKAQGIMKMSETKSRSVSEWKIALKWKFSLPKSIEEWE